MSTNDACRAITLEAANDMTGLLGNFCIIDSSGQVASGTTTLTAQGIVNGIVSEESATAVGDPVTVTVPDGGIVKVKLGQTMVAGDPVATAADGRAIDPGTTAGDITWGTLITGGVANDIVSMQFMFTKIDPGT